MKATKALAIHRKRKEEVLHASLKALCCSCGSWAKSAVSSHMQPCESCRNHQNHAQNIGWSQESDWEGQSHCLTPQKKGWQPCDGDCLYPQPGLNSSEHFFSCSGNFTSGFNGPAFIGEKIRQPEALQPPSLNPVSTANRRSCVWFPICNWTYHSGSWQPCATSHLRVILHKATGISSREILHSVVSGSSSIL